MTQNATAIEIGQHRTFSAGPDHELVVTRTAAGYVVTAQRAGQPLPCFTRVFDRVDELPAGMSLKKAAFVYLLNLYRDFTGVDVEQAIAALSAPPDPAPLPEALYRILLAAHVNGGRISPRRDCPTHLLRALANRGDMTLEYAGSRVRYGIVTGQGRETVQREYTTRRTATLTHAA